jgi:cellulose synthase/poly-beta-1,6-N-acetylglucosamine synthase-like glycosyltransferase
MELITGLYLLYAFVSIYFFFFFFLLYVSNRDKIFSYPKKIKEYEINIVIPCYNKEKEISDNIKSVLDLNYKNIKKIIVVDDCSTDNSAKIIKDYAKKYEKIIYVKTPKNTGCAAGAKNYGAKFADSEIIGFVDADSFLQKDSINKMVGFFSNPKVATVTPQILVRNRKKFLSKLQAVEYKLISLTRKLMSFVDAIYVAPGPLALYRNKIFREIGGFDEKNITEDIEITWNIVAHNYKTEMSFPARVYTESPEKFKIWLKQRIRWTLGGMQTVKKYKGQVTKMGTLGSFILPFFIFAWIIALFGFIIIGYRMIKSIILRYISTTYSIKAETAILTLRDINLTPNVLIFFGAITIIFSAYMIWIAIINIKEEEFKKQGLFAILFYMFIYVMFYPIILIISAYKFLRNKGNW